MLKGGGSRQLQSLTEFFHQLPGVERIEQINIARCSVEHGKGQCSIFDKNAGRFLMWITPIPQLQLILILFQVHGFLHFYVFSSYAKSIEKEVKKTSL